MLTARPSIIRRRSSCIANCLSTTRIQSARLQQWRYFSDTFQPDDNDNTKQQYGQFINSSEDPPSKNTGTIVGAWIFCRHGDRTPSRCLCPTHRQTDEAHFWLTKLPSPSTAAVYKDFCASFPPVIDDPSGHFMDVHRNPFGFVTHKGLMQMQTNGRLLRQRYDPVFTNTTGKDNLADDEFLRNWRISAYSTNYLRTVLSVQSFLDGLLHTQLYTPETTRDDMDFSTMRPQEWPVPDHNFIQASPFDDDDDTDSDHDENLDPTHDDSSVADDNEGYGSDWEQDPKHNVLNLYLSDHTKEKQRHRPKVFVRVRDQSCDNLNAFDRNPDLMKDLVGDVMQNPKFQRTDANAAPIAARLANILPGLARKGRKDFSATTPSGINWVEAADHFVCRTAHDLELSKFSDSEHDANVEQMLSAMTYKALGHLAWRFRQWYQNPQLLAAIAAPPLREIAQQLEHLVHQSNNNNNKKNKNNQTSIRALQDPHANFLCIYSCHDVTLLALLYALGADFLADESSAVWREYWPKYASTLVMELVRLDDHDAETHQSSHVMRVLINGKVVISTDFMFSKFEQDQQHPRVPGSSLTSLADINYLKDRGQNSNPLGHGPHQLLTTDDFWNVIQTLESMGEYDFSRWPAMKEEGGKNKPTGRPRHGSLNSSLN